MRLSFGLVPSLLFSLSLARSLEVKWKRQSLDNSTAYAVQEPPLTTNWTYEVGTNPWPEYPRPQLERSQWQNLNGIWKYVKAYSTADVNSPPDFSSAREVLVPSCLESGLSGIQGNDTLYSWFQTTFTVPLNWTSSRVLLNFGAVDYEATVFINGQQAGFHRGGYFHFALDVTDFLSNSTNSTFGGEGVEHKLTVFVHDPTDSEPYVIPIGKQTLTPSHIFYTPCSGIWQSVWIESAPSNWIERLDLAAAADGTVNVTVHSIVGNYSPVQVSVIDRDSGDVVATQSGSSDKAFTFKVSSPKLWHPDSPNLYDIAVTLGDDEIKSYTGFRTISRGVVNGIDRPLINGEFTFIFGTLDQGYWPDGLYTPPNNEAMVFDLHTLKNLGFNMLRKHIKVENGLYYKACDELGILLVQDMPALKQTNNLKPNAAQQQEFERQLELLVNQHKSYTSIMAWVIYNEGWGQITVGEYPEFRLTDFVKSLDPTRLVDSTSGWYDHGAGDFSDNHHYATSQCGAPFYSLQSSPYDPRRIGFQGEFGGIGHNVSIDHLWNNIDAINSINQTYEINADLKSYNYRAHVLFTELLQQVQLFACSGGVWTQTTDVEGEVNGLLTYDRRILRTDVRQWQGDIQALYDAAAARSNGSAVEERALFWQSPDY